MCTWVHGFNNFNLCQTQKLIDLQINTICKTKLLKGEFVLPPSSSHIDMPKVTVCRSWVASLFHCSNQTPEVTGCSVWEPLTGSR